MEPGDRQARIHIPLAIGIALVLIVSYVVVDTVGAPESAEPSESWRQAGAAGATPSADDSAIAAVPEPTRYGFGAMTSAEGDPQRVAEAIRLFRRGLELDPFDAGAVFGLGWAYQSLGDLAQAERFYRVAVAQLRIEPEVSDIEIYTHHNLGYLYETRDQAEAAAVERAHSQLVETSVGSQTDVTEVVLASRALYDLARVVLPRLAEAPPVARARFRDGLAEWRAARLDRAEAVFVEILAAPPGAPRDVPTELPRPQIDAGSAGQ